MPKLQKFSTPADQTVRPNKVVNFVPQSHVNGLVAFREEGGIAAYGARCTYALNAPRQSDYWKATLKLQLPMPCKTVDGDCAVKIAHTSYADLSIKFPKNADAGERSTLIQMLISSLQAMEGEVGSGINESLVNLEGFF